MALSRWGVQESGLSPSCCLSYLSHRSWPGLLQCQASASPAPSIKIGIEVFSAPFFHIQASKSLQHMQEVLTVVEEFG